MQAEPCTASCCNGYLSDISARDKPWDVNKGLSQKVAQLYQGTICDRLYGKINGCAGQLQFGWVSDPKTGEARLKLKSALFCRSRLCMTCQWRKALMWTGRFLQAMPAILRDYPSARFIFLTLTVRNCELSDLRPTLEHMNKSWRRMSQRKSFPAIGFVKSMEVTRNWDVSYKGAYQGRLGGKTLDKWKKDHKGYKAKELVLKATTEVHPHFHALLMVEPGYFAGHSYLSQSDWTELWRSCLRIDYTPIVDVKAVKPNKRWQTEGQGELLPAEQLLAGAIVETVKYSVKPGDLVGEGTEDDRQWLLQLTQQLEHTRAVALGGVFRNYLSDSEPEDLIGEDGKGEEISESSIYFGWRELAQRYLKVWED